MASQITSVSDDQAAERDANYQAANIGNGAVPTQYGIVRTRSCLGLQRRVRNGGNTGEQKQKDGEVTRKRQIMPIFSIRTSAVHL